jgi:anti-sigma factor (TIGR02949 family)
MSAVRQPSCRDLGRLLGPYLDGELEAQSLVDIESHVVRCPECHEQVELLRAMRASLRRAVRSTTPDGLRRRIATAMEAERARGEARQQEEIARTGGKLTSWRTMVPLATAAAFALAWGVVSHGDGSPRSEVRAGFGGDDLLAELVSLHSQPLPPEHTDPKAVGGYSKYVGVPVHPASFERGGAKLVGGRILPLHQQRAAVLQYVLVHNGGEPQRVSVMVYDPQRIQIGQANLATHAVGSAEVRVGRQKGYAVAVTEHDGVGCAVASDGDQDESAQLVALGCGE